MKYTYTGSLAAGASPPPPVKTKKRSVAPPKVKILKDKKAPIPKLRSVEASRSKSNPIGLPQSVVPSSAATVAHTTKIPERVNDMERKTYSQTPSTQQTQYAHSPSRSPTPTDKLEQPHGGYLRDASKNGSSNGNSRISINSSSISESMEDLDEALLEEQHAKFIQRKKELEGKLEAHKAANQPIASTGTLVKKAKLASSDGEDSETEKIVEKKVAAPAKTGWAPINKIPVPASKLAAPINNISVSANKVTEVANKLDNAEEDKLVKAVSIPAKEVASLTNKEEIETIEEEAPAIKVQAAVNKVPAPANKVSKPATSIKTGNATRTVIRTLSAPVSRSARTTRTNVAAAQSSSITATPPTSTVTSSTPSAPATSRPTRITKSTAESASSKETPSDSPTRPTRKFADRNIKDSSKSAEAHLPRRTRSRTAPSASAPEPANRRSGRKRTADTDSEEEKDQSPVPPSTIVKRGPKAKRAKKSLPILSGRYKLSLVFKGHTDINIPAKSIGDDDLEDAKDLWCCGFEPTRPRQTQTSNMVAFCGSYTVLFLDTHLKSYTKKYTHPEVQEIFYCMAWTTLSGKEELLNADINEEDPSCNILAVAGRMGSIKLLNPLQNDCYRYLFGHDKPVLKLAFAKTEPRWLFSASADKTVRLWDIGSPTSKQDDSVCLAKFNLPAKSGVPSALSISHDLKTLMVGFEGGDMITFIITDDHIDTFRTKAEEFRSKESQSKNKWDRFGALAIIEPKSIFPQGDEWHEGYIDDIYIFGQDGDTSNKLYNKIISRGADDMEFIIWDPAKSTKKDVDIITSLTWPESQNCTGVRFKVIEAEGQKVLLAGEYDGQIYIYNVGDMKRSKILDDDTVEQFKPEKILSHSMSSELIRDVCCSSDTRTIVAVDNNNTVFVWDCIDAN